jgi:hypothetical protein
VEKHEHLPLRRLLREPTVERDHPLVVAIEEVDLEPGDTPLLEAIERRLELNLRVRPGTKRRCRLASPARTARGGDVDLGVRGEEVVGSDQNQSTFTYSNPFRAAKSTW